MGLGVLFHKHTGQRHGEYERRSMPLAVIKLSSLCQTDLATAEALCPQVYQQESGLLITVLQFQTRRETRLY